MAVGVLELLGARKMDVRISDRSGMEDIPDARAGLSGFPVVCARMFRDVCDRRVAVQPKICCGEEISEIVRCAPACATFAPYFFLRLPYFSLASSRASELHPSRGHGSHHLMYSGKTDQAIALARTIEAARPGHPLGYLIEADVLWWRLDCRWSERKYSTIDAWSLLAPV